MGGHLSDAEMADTPTKAAANHQMSRVWARVRFPVAAFSVWRLAQLVVVRAFGTWRPPISGLAPASHPAFFRWDGAWYQQIARHGYHPFPGNGQQPANFFPLLSWLTVAVQAIVRSEFAAALIVVTAGGLAATVLVHEVVLAWRGASVARLAVLFFLAWPASLFLGIFYTEGLFIALVAGALLAQIHDRPALAGLLAAAATLTRPPGMVLVLVLMAAHLQRHRRLEWRVAWYAVGALGLLPLIVAQHIQA